MRRAADSVSAGSEPQGFDIYIGYDDGRYLNVPAIRALLPQLNPNARLWGVTVFPLDDEGDWIDVENGDATPADAPPWVARRRAAGHPNPGVYCSEAVWEQVKAEFLRQNVPMPIFWIAGYPGSVGVGNIYPGAVGHQDADIGPYDRSVFLDYIPGLDPAPTGADEMPQPTDVVDSWSVPGSGGSAYFDLHADGGLFAYGGAVPTELEYVASANDGSRFHFGPTQTPGVVSYPGLPAADREGTRYFVAFTVLSYKGQSVAGATGPEGPAGPTGPAGPQGPAGPVGAVNLSGFKSALMGAVAALP